MTPLRARGISVRLGGRMVLRDVDLEVSRGELVALIGPNGAGKTTLLRTILGLVRPASGRVDIAGTKRRRGTAVGYVPQRHDFAWDFPISVENAVMSGLTGRLGLFRRPGVAHWQAVTDAVRRVGMEALAQRPVGELSGGQKQKVAVARALALEPEVLLLDEPYTGLDLPTQDMLSDLFASLAREGRAVLMTTHDIVSAMFGADRIALINETIVAAGPPSELVGDPLLWTGTFGVREDSSLLRVLKAGVA